MASKKDCSKCETKRGCVCAAISEAAIQDVYEIAEDELMPLTGAERAEVLRRLQQNGILAQEEWLVKNGEGWYWDLDDFSDEPQWVELRRDACRFIERANAVHVAKRHGGRVVHLVSTPNGGPADGSR